MFVVINRIAWRINYNNLLFRENASTASGKANSDTRLMRDYRRKNEFYFSNMNQLRKNDAQLISIIPASCV